MTKPQQCNRLQAIPVTTTPRGQLIPTVVCIRPLPHRPGDFLLFLISKDFIVQFIKEKGPHLFKPDPTPSPSLLKYTPYFFSCLQSYF
jgi:hypothetical protein